MAYDLEINPASKQSTLDYTAAPVLRPEHREDSFTRLIEHQTAKISSDVFLFFALGSMGASLFYEVVNNSRMSRFVGMWAPTLLILGVYNKLVKITGPH